MVAHCSTNGFRVHPNYGNDLRRQYNYILHEIAGSQLLKFVLDQVTGRDLKIEMKGDIAEDVLEANYSLS